VVFGILLDRPADVSVVFSALGPRGRSGRMTLVGPVFRPERGFKAVEAGKQREHPGQVR